MGIMIGRLFLLLGTPAIMEDGETSSGASCRGLVGGDIKLSEDAALILVSLGDRKSFVGEMNSISWDRFRTRKKQTGK
jgi:hypothetical protein